MRFIAAHYNGEGGAHNPDRRAGSAPQGRAAHGAGFNAVAHKPGDQRMFRLVPTLNRSHAGTMLLAVTARWIRATLVALLFLSGFGALGAQIAWAKLFANGLGHEMPSVLALVAAVMGGMALGAGALDAPLARARAPGSWYGGLEAAIALWGCASVLLIPLGNDVAAWLIGVEASPARHWFVAFVLPFLTLLPATAAMGATLPAMDRWLAPLTPGGRCLGALYAANTLGAVCGALAAAFVVLPALGLTRSVALFAQANLVCGVAAWLLAVREREREHAPPDAPSQTNPRTALPDQGAAGVTGALSKNRVCVTIFLTGLLAMGFETLGVRLLSQVLENTIYTYAVTLAVFLGTSALGAAAYQRWWRLAPTAKLVGTLLAATVGACALAGLALAGAHEIYRASRGVFGSGIAGGIVAEIATAAVVIAPPSFLMGAICAGLLQSARAPAGGVGRALAWNTVGAALSPGLFGVLLLPWLGGKLAWALLALGYFALALSFAPKRAVWAGAVFLAWINWPADLRLLRLEEGERVRAFRAGVMASVAVIEDAAGERTLRVNNRFQMGGTAAAAREHLQAHLPLLLHPSPRRALFLGTGTGITLGAATVHPELQCDGVELLPEAVELMPEFEPHNFGAARLPQVRMRVADARRFVRARAERYDVIVADLFHPGRDGAGTLYTVEHFRALRERLSPGGLACQWLPLHQLDLRLLRIIARSFLAAFPDAQAWWLDWNADTPVLGLIGGVGSDASAHGTNRRGPLWVEDRRGRAPALDAELRRLALSDSVRLFGRLAADNPTLRRFAADAPLNTDDHPRVMFEAPRMEQGRALNLGRLAELLARWRECNGSSALGLDPDADSFAERVARFRRARDEFVLGQIADWQGDRDGAIEHYVGSAELSGDFTAGYAQCLTWAAMQARSRPEAARALLHRLVAAQPERRAARELLERLEERD